MAKNEVDFGGHPEFLVDSGSLSVVILPLGGSSCVKSFEFTRWEHRSRQIDV